MENIFLDQLKKCIKKKQGGKLVFEKAAKDIGIGKTTLHDILVGGTNPKLYTTMKKIMLYTGCVISCNENNELECHINEENKRAEDGEK